MTDAEISALAREIGPEELNRQYIEAADAYVRAKEEGRKCSTEYRKLRKLWAGRVHEKNRVREALLDMARAVA